MRKPLAFLITFAMIVCMFPLNAYGSQEAPQPLSEKEFREKWNVRSSVRKVILDTDLGFFLDDVYALHALLQADRLGYLELCGITTCCGNSYTAGVTYDTLAYLDHVGSDIPVYQGSDTPLSGEIDLAQLEKLSGKMSFCGFYDLRDRYTNDYRKALENGLAWWNGKAPESVPMEQSAADYIIEEIHRYPGEVTILALGGLTNIARALQKDPGIAQDAAGIIYMGGVFDVWGEDQKQQEFNFWCDPVAANIALSAGWKNQVIASHDAATTCLKTYDLYRIASEHNHNPFSELFLAHYEEGCGSPEEIERKFEEDLPYCWDPITITYILCPEICTSIETRYLRIDDRMGPTYGSTLNWREGKQPENTYPAQVILSVDQDRFWEFLFDLFDAQ